MQPRPTGSKSRPTARKRLNADDSPFIGPSAGAKRAGDKPEASAEPRAKRKRIETPSTTGMTSMGGSLSKRTDKGATEGEPVALTVDFHSLPDEAIHRYLVYADVVPVLYPSPCSTENPPLPSSLLNPLATAPRAPSPVLAATPANRPKRDGPKDVNRRRSSRLREEDARSRRAPILADVEAVHDVLATLAGRHFERQGVKEGDAVQQFLLTVKSR